MSSILGLAGAALGGIIGGPSGAALGASIGGGMDRNATQSDVASDANAFSAQQYATRYQTQVADMKAAGLNPMLAYTQSPGSAPAGQQYQVSNPFERVASDYSSAANVERQGSYIEAQTISTRAEAYLKEAQTLLAGTSADQGRATIAKLEMEAKKISEEIKNIPKEGDRLVALVKNLGESSSLIGKQAATEGQRVHQIKWLALKTMIESDLLDFDKQAIQTLDNFGKTSSQLKPLIDMILSMSRALRR